MEKTPVRINRQQWQWLHGYLGGPLRRLSRLRSRLQRAGMTPSDPYMQKLDAAYDAIHSLAVSTHYNSCDANVVAGANRQVVPDDSDHVRTSSRVTDAPS